MRCPKCETENLADSAFCVECGAKLEPVCAACGAENPPGAKFCRRCGEALGDHPAPETYTPEHIADKILSAKSSTEGESSSSDPATVARSTESCRVRA